MAGRELGRLALAALRLLRPAPAPRGALTGAGSGGGRGTVLALFGRKALKKTGGHEFYAPLDCLVPFASLLSEIKHMRDSYCRP